MNNQFGVQDNAEPMVERGIKARVLYAIFYGEI